MASERNACHLCAHGIQTTLSNTILIIIFRLYFDIAAASFDLPQLLYVFPLKSWRLTCLKPFCFRHGQKLLHSDVFVILKTQCSQLNAFYFYTNFLKSRKQEVSVWATTTHTVPIHTSTEIWKHQNRCAPNSGQLNAELMKRLLTIFHFSGRSEGLWC